MEASNVEAEFWKPHRCNVRAGIPEFPLGFAGARVLNSLAAEFY